MLDFSKIVSRMTLLETRLRWFESTCGAGLIHDTRTHLNIMVNWLKNFEYYTKYPEKLELHNWSKRPIEKYVPTQDQLDKYFKDLMDKAEDFLVKNANWRKDGVCKD
jgi:hypothetical protein